VVVTSAVVPFCLCCCCCCCLHRLALPSPFSFCILSIGAVA
jgi:hypothetical protein